MLIRGYRQTTDDAELFQTSSVRPKPCSHSFRLFGCCCFSGNKNSAHWRFGSVEVKEGRLSFPQRGEQSTASTQRNDAISSDACHFKADFILMRDEHNRITVWSNRENEVSFVVSFCE